METSFKISVSDESLALLSQKLALTRLPDEASTFDDWSYGVPLSDIRRLLTRWRDGYDWRAAESKLNEELPMFTRKDLEVEGFDAFQTHYVHKKCERKNAIPLLFLHGWPGHFAEVRKILPLLTKPDSENKPAFHVVAPSLPGYGFSSAPKKQGFCILHYAELMHKLMLALGYDEYVVQGGDWGHVIGQRMTHMYGGKYIKAWHSNFPRTHPPKLRQAPLAYLSSFITPLSASENEALERYKEFGVQGLGFFAIQATKPHTLGFSLADSPAGLLAWIYEKLVAVTDEYPWDDDEVLTWISIYYHSLSGPAASSNIYYEAQHAGELSPENGKLWTNVPVGLSWFPKELVFTPKSWAPGLGNVVYMAEHSKGGHFAAYEQPNELAKDLWEMFGKGGPAFGVVSERNGY